MIAIEQLRYVRLATRDLAAAADFAQRILGLQPAGRDDTHAAFRSDHRDPTLMFHAGDPALQAVGFEIHGDDAFTAAVAALEAEGLAVTRGDPAQCAARKVRALASVDDPAGNAIELVSRPLDSGWRYFPSRDSGVQGLAAVALCATDAPAAERFWTRLFNARVSDRVGDAAYLRLDDAHHRIAYHPSARRGVLAVEFAVENVDLLMQNSYFLQAAQIRASHGPGRRPASDQLFLTFPGPDGVLYSFVAEGSRIADEARHRPRQFPRAPLSLCNWGSETSVPELDLRDRRQV